MKKKWVLATGNKGKVQEMSELLNSFSIEVLPQSQFEVSDVAETGTTFVENAIIKARHAAKVTGLPAIADDSGLEVDFLNGQPGIRSARFAGENATDQENIELLLSKLEGIGTEQRRARFQCVLVYLRHELDPTPIICQGTWQGIITESQQGENGFGYDPVFWVESEQSTSAQLSKQRKAELSHRGQALGKLVELLKKQLG
ncbi:non-canonical purine NTP pyrophosphatase, rdgB/HAM1 family protein [Psychromonas ingrahamii 37]|uniref:dITP/XTP pyrophosphatase n=1 Tax=Psychromonas ingrahamii (strain DSM 17664 / CCUG 51855 / 37) TaxID=357804 RepID=A1SZ32_PSYIN|nr:XTP/dITP diphosphatase [Psychromonas ingrahamii]ABM04747.1 non-canonical purine NTP pyrophosphatase, rdgB/HAM1 family protein [Psychromonas ingrahamii 37]